MFNVTAAAAAADAATAVHHSTLRTTYALTWYDVLE